MMTVGQLAQHFLSIEPQKNQARLAFYHFLKNFLPLQSTFTPEMVDIFYDRALSLNHWQVHKNELGEALKSDLAAINARHPIGLDIEQLVHANELQVINLEQFRDFFALISTETEKYEKLGDKVKTFRLTNDRSVLNQEVMILRINKSGSIFVEVRPNIAILVEGRLQLIRPTTRLAYTAELDFDQNVEQVLTTSHMRVARFKTSSHLENKVKGSVIQGTSFHCTENFDKRIEELPEVFQAVKNIERYYVNPVTDPFYQQIVENYRQVFHEKNI